MEQQFHKFPSIEQFRNVITNVRHWANATGNALPSYQFTGTVKLHGTNAAVSFPNGPRAPEVLYQSREQFLSLGNDNAGFCAAMQGDSLHTVRRAAQIASQMLNFGTYDPVVVYGEWCGGNIQKGVAINGLPKMFVIFGIAFPGGPGNPPYWAPQGMLESIGAYFAQQDREEGTTPVYFAHQFPTYTVRVDFERPEEAQQTLAQITSEVEEQCPVGAALGSPGIGEGVVWVYDIPLNDNNPDNFGRVADRIVFKVKGEKHSASKVKTLASVDVEKVRAVREAVEYVFTEARMQQMFSETAQRLGIPEDEVTSAHTGEFIRACMSDAAKEESDTLEKNGIDWKEFSKVATSYVRQYFLARI